jgi:predicted ABC-type ATPase
MRDDRPLEQRAGTDLPRVDEAGSRTDLARRLGSLPDGHPSSRYETDGTPRETGVQLRDLDTSSEDDDARAPDRRPPFTDAEWSEHVPDTRARLDKACSDDLLSNRQHTTPPDHTEWTPDRNRLQGQLVADLYERARDVPCSGLAIIAGGLGGAGKSTVLEKHAGIDRSQYLTINPDDIKEEMARRGMIPVIEGLSPMEASQLVHEESSFIAKRLALLATADRKNLIWDITMASQPKTERRIDELRANGYRVDGIFVDIPVETSIRRADARHREGENDYRAGIGLGGRYVPPEVIEAQVDPDWGSQNRKTFEGVSQRFDHWSRYDNSVDGRSPVLEASTPDPKNNEETAS